MVNLPGEDGMRNAENYRNIVFDMGGVLVDYTADNATWQFTDDPDIVREIHNVLFCSQEWLALDMGAITDEQAIIRILPRLSSEKVREIARITFDHWHEYTILHHHYKCLLNGNIQISLCILKRQPHQH